MRKELQDVLCEYTWKAVLSASDAEFEALWDEMIEKLDGLGYDDLYANDVEVYQKEIDMKQAAAQ